MNRIQKVLGSVAVASLIAVMPFAASADTLSAKGSTGVVINPNGIVRVIGADVTSVGNSVLGAVTNLGDIVINWLINVSASTRIVANGSSDATTTDIKVGDKISFTGSLSSSAGNLLTVAATKVRDVTNFPFRHFGAGTISSVNEANGSFVLIVKDDRMVTVQTNASTTIRLNGATTTFGALTVGERVRIVGTLNADGSVITASDIVLKDSHGRNGRDDDDDGDRDDRRHSNRDDDRSRDDNSGHSNSEARAAARVEAHAHADRDDRDGDSRGIRTLMNFFGEFHLGAGRND
ncbi:MAG: DUF5666 domain-containing protein [Patescibacteria group bacterium]|nr:DUF5666 domain-containing protein [Patescibacteria group bacterium]